MRAGIFVKFNSSGTQEWNITINDTHDDVLEDVVVDSSGPTVIENYGSLENVEKDANNAVKSTYPNQSGYYSDGTKEIILPNNN